MRKPKVLVVDDDPDILEILELTLENDYQVLTATDGEQALEKIKNDQSSNKSPKNGGDFREVTNSYLLF